MNAINLAEGDRIKIAVESFLSELNRATKQSGTPIDKIICRSSKKNSEIRAVGYIHREDSIFSDEERSIILIPSKPDVTLDEGLSILIKNRVSEGCHRMFYVDCYSTCDTSSRKTSEYMSPNILWDKFIGGRILPFSAKYNRENNDLLLDVEHEYRTRVLQLVDSNKPSNIDITKAEGLFSLSGSAMDILGAWARSERNDLQDRLLVFGEAGIGKTWLLFRFAQGQKMVSDSNSPWTHPAAIYIDLSSVRDDLLMGTGLNSLLSKHILLNGYAPHPRGGIQTIEALISSGSVILLLDEFDTITQQFDNTVVEHHYRIILQSLPLRARLIVATRSTRFESRDRMISTFTMKDPYGRDGSIQLAHEHEGKGVAPFSALTLGMFSDFQDFLSGVIHNPDNLEDSDSITDLSHLALGDNRLDEIGRIPRYADTVRRLLPYILTNGCDRFDRMRVFELTILWQLRFNLITGRAVYRLPYKEFGKWQSELLDLHTRLKILERVAWFLIEFNRDKIDTDEMKYAILEYAPGYFEEAINDLKCQTFFEFCDGNSSNLRFRLEVLKAFFIARRICSLLYRNVTTFEGSEEEVKRGIRSLGLINALAIDNSYQFLQEFFRIGFLSVPPDPPDGPMEAPEREGYWKNKIKYLQSNSILSNAKELIISERAFSNSTCHLVENLKLCNIDVSSLSEKNEWSRILDKKKEVESRERLKTLCSKGILVHGIQEYKEEHIGIRPFIIAKQEVVNREFSEFLGKIETSSEKPFKIPYLNGLDDEAINYFDNKKLKQPTSWRQVYFKAKRINTIHPFSWEGIHKTVDQSPSDDSRWLSKLTNDYHLFDWTNGRIPVNADEQPVVWISFYVAAVYCNWKSEQEGLVAAYKILLQVERKAFLNNKHETGPLEVIVLLNPKANGYRLPFASEWAFAARADRPLDSFPWDGESSPVRQRLKNALTAPQSTVLPVTRSYCNDFGVYGMIGNVREWAEGQYLYNRYCANRTSGNNLILQELTQPSRIMGSTWALGESTFRYSHSGPSIGMALPRCNTNPDVGFRWARSLLLDDEEFVNREEKRKVSLRLYET